MPGPRPTRTHAWWQRAILVASMMLVNGLLGGCYIEPSASDLAAIRGGKETLVLIRLACGDPQHERPEFLAATGMNPGAISNAFKLGYVDEDGQPHEIHAVVVGETAWALSKASWSEGWFALAWPPGYRYLAFGMSRARVDFISIIPFQTPAKLPPEAPLWRIEVPAKTPVIYAGTFRALPCDSANSREKAQQQFAESPSTLRVEDERETAAAVLRRDAPTLPPPVTRLAILQTGPLLHGVPPSDQTQ